MFEALKSLFIFFVENVGVPIRDAIVYTNFCDTIRQFINLLFPSIFKLWNNNNSAFDNFFTTGNFAGIISEVISLLLLLFCLWFVLRIFISVYNIICKGLLKC